MLKKVGSKKLDLQEIFEEIVSLLHYYSMKLYFSRRKKEIFNIC
jgi:predicted site-specific integrase-resolvase